MGGLDGPPKPPLPSERPGEAVALLDAPLTLLDAPLRSERPGEAVALLESLGYLGDFEEAAQFD
jgi:hypothetical protein